MAFDPSGDRKLTGKDILNLLAHELDVNPEVLKNTLISLVHSSNDSFLTEADYAELETLIDKWNKVPLKPIEKVDNNLL